MQNETTKDLLKLLSACIFDNHPETIWQTFSPKQQVELIEKANLFNIQGILFYYLKELFPKEFVRKCKVDFVTLAAKSIQREKAIAELQRIFYDNKIEFRIIKGAFLASCVYPNPALRYSCDIDLLVKKSDAARAFELTTAHGWHHYNHQKTIFHLPKQIKKHVALDIHTSLFDTVRKENEKIWQEFARKENNLELILLHVLSHSARNHNFLNVEKTLIDVGFILKQKNIDWDYFKYLEDAFKTKGIFSLFLASFPEFFAPGIIDRANDVVPLKIQNALRDISFCSTRAIESQLYISFFFKNSWKNFKKKTIGVFNSLTLLNMSMRFKISKPKILCFYPYFLIKTFAIRIKKFFKLRNYLKKEQPQERIQGSKTVAKIQDYIDRQN